MENFKLATLLTLIVCLMSPTTSTEVQRWEAEELYGDETISLVRIKRTPMPLSYDIDQQFESGLGPHHVEHAVALTHTINHGVAHPLPHGLGHAVSTTAGHGLLQTHPPPAIPHHHVHKIGYGHGYSLGSYKGYGPTHSVVGLHYGGFGVGVGYGGHGHGHGYFL